LQTLNKKRETCLPDVLTKSIIFHTHQIVAITHRLANVNTIAKSVILSVTPHQFLEKIP